MRHKTALVSALSMVGVLMAGATALGANMGILNTNDGLGELTAVSDTVATTTTSTETTGSTVAQGELMAYQINGVGVVTLSREGRQLSLESAEVGSWSYTVEKQGKELSLVFNEGDRAVNFTAHVENGRILVDVWEDNVVVETTGGASGGSSGDTTGDTTATTAPATSTTSYGDDQGEDDDGQYDDGEYEDDDHEDGAYEDDEYEDGDHSGGGYEDDDQGHEEDD